MHLKGVNVRKASGPDGVGPHLLRPFAVELTTPLVFIFGQRLVTRVWLFQWKEARVTLVHKKKEKSNPSDYHPISLLSVVSKIFERVIEKQVTSFLDDHHLHSPRQFRFRKGLSTSDLLLLLSKSRHNALDAGGPSLGLRLCVA